MPEITEPILFLEDNGQVANIFGNNDQHLNTLEEKLNVKIISRGPEITAYGEEDNVQHTKGVLQYLATLSTAGIEISTFDVNYALSLQGHNQEEIAVKLTDSIYVTPKNKQIKPKSIGQYHYLQAIKHHDLTFGIGPAGTGKTYLAVVMAVLALKKKEVARIVLARPAVEAGEKLGFLPGDLQDKVNPYLRPVYDALDDILGVEMAAKFIERNIIEVVPLAYMRGRTLEDAFIILDEAQNTTQPQMKMFLTRIGLGSKVVVTGDPTQVDLPSGQNSGLFDAERRLKDIPEIMFCRLHSVDVVRHPLVQKIIEAYERKWV